MPLKCGSESTDYQYYQVNEIERALATMTKFGIPETDPTYQALWARKGIVSATVGYKIPRLPTQLRLPGFSSPHGFGLWHDPESGWMVEIRAFKGAPPLYKAVGDELAMAVLRDELTPTQEKWLLVLDEYLGE